MISRRKIVPLDKFIGSAPPYHNSNSMKYILKYSHLTKEIPYKYVLNCFELLTHVPLPNKALRGHELRFCLSFFSTNQPKMIPM